MNQHSEKGRLWLCMPWPTFPTIRTQAALVAPRSSSLAAGHWDPTYIPFLPPAIVSNSCKNMLMCYNMLRNKCPSDNILTSRRERVVGLICAFFAVINIRFLPGNLWPSKAISFCKFRARITSPPWLTLILQRDRFFFITMSENFNPLYMNNDLIHKLTRQICRIEKHLKLGTHMYVSESPLYRVCYALCLNSKYTNTTTTVVISSDIQDRGRWATLETGGSIKILLTVPRCLKFHWDKLTSTILILS